jgi:imidazoleglycerol-phosphate dehydratase/histidinol-phosphatase
MKKFVFFDRDGTLIEHVHHLVDYKLVVLKPDLIESLSKLSSGGFSLGIVTNQSVISRGLATIEDVQKINDVIENRLHEAGISFEVILICPHIEEDSCECRKPKTGLLKSLMQEKSIDFANSFMVGDQSSDIQFGVNIGVKTAQVGLLSNIEGQADFLGHTLIDVADWILREDLRGCGIL